MTETDWDALLPRLLLYAEGSRRACKQEKDADEVLIHQETALVLDDAADCIEAQRAEGDRLKSINRDLLAALKVLLVHAPKTQARYPTQYQADARQARDAIARATEELKP